MKKARNLFLCLLVLLMLLPATVYADIGPKPSVRVQLKKLPEPVCYVTLLALEESTGPYSWAPEQTQPAPSLVQGDEELGARAWRAFQQYQDPDGFHFLQFFRRCSSEQEFLWSYRPPQTYKVLVWLPESGTFLVSEPCESYAFHTHFAARPSTQGSLIVSKSYPYFWELVSLGVRCLGTILLELLIAVLLRIRGRALKDVLWVNVVTQILLNTALSLIGYRSGPWAFVFHLIWMELVVMLVEALIYKLQFRRHGEGRPQLWLTYAAVANGFSFLAGLVLARYIPGIF